MSPYEIAVERMAQLGPVALGGALADGRRARWARVRVTLDASAGSASAGAWWLIAEEIGGRFGMAKTDAETTLEITYIDGPAPEAEPTRENRRAAC